MSVILQIHYSQGLVRLVTFNCYMWLHNFYLLKKRHKICLTITLIFTSQGTEKITGNLLSATTIRIIATIFLNLFKIQKPTKD